MSELVRYEAAKQAIAECKAVDEALDIRDKMEAMRVYARQIHDTQLETDAAEIKQRAMRQYDKLLKAQRQAGELPSGRGGRPTRAQRENRHSGMQVSKMERENARNLGALSDESFERAIAEQRDEGKVPTIRETVERGKGERPVIDLEVRRQNRANRCVQRLRDALAAVDDAVADMNPDAIADASPAVLESLANWHYEYCESAESNSVGRWINAASWRLETMREDDVG